MRKTVISFLYFLAFLLIEVRAQLPLQPQAMPPYYINNLTVNATNGIDLHQSETIISTGNESEPVNITGTAKVDFKASKEVELKPGFTASNFTGDGEFHAYVKELPFEVAWFEPTTNVGTVPKYEKLELGIKLPQDIQDNINDFLNDPTYPFLPSGDQINPYNPEQLSVEIHLTSPDNRTITKYGFYYKEFEVVPSPSYTLNNETFSTFWDNVGTTYPFRIRFAPDFADINNEWTYQIKIILNGNTEIGTYNGRFLCTPSENKGYLEVSENNNRYFRFKDTHESFFAIGENLAFPYYNAMMTPSIEGRAEELMSQLSNSGGNYFRLWMATWALGVERERLGVYDIGQNDIGYWSPVLNPPFNGLVDRQYHAWELDKIINRAHDLDLYIQLCLEGNSHSPNTGNPNIPGDLGDIWLSTTWQGSSYQNLSGVSLIDDFFTKEQAKEYYKRKLRYIISRWGYSTNIATWELFNEIDFQFELPGSNTPLSETRIQSVGNWHNDMANEIKNVLGDNHLVSTNFGYDFHYFNGLDFISRNAYSHNRDFILGDLAPLVKQTTAANEKPMVIGESDLYYIDQLSACSPLSFHNRIWASSFTGSVGTFLNWEWNTIHRPDLRYYEDFKPLANFMQGIDHEWNNWFPFTNATGISGNSILTSPDNVETFYMTNFNGSQVMGWFHNRTAYWANDEPDCYATIYDNNGNVIEEIECAPDDNPCLEFILPLSQQSLFVSNLPSGTEFQLQFYDTHSPTVTTIDYPETVFALYDGYVYFETPELTADKPDWAFKMWPVSQTSFRNNEQPYLRDTTVCAGEYFTPYHLLHNFSDSSITVNWIFSGNSPSAQLVAYIPGVYSIKAILNNHGDTDTISAKIFIKDCNLKPSEDFTYNSNTRYWLDAIKTAQPNTSVTAITEKQEKNKFFKVYPVPAKNTLSIESLDEERNWNYELYNITGALTLQGISLHDKKELEVSRFAKGVYLLKIKSEISGATGYKIIID